MSEDQKTTLPVDYCPAGELEEITQVGSSGLLQFHPLGAPPVMAFHALIRLPTVIGRAESCDIRLDDPSVSRRHASLHIGPAGCRVEDNGSTGGVFVNGQRVTAATLSGGEILRLANTLLIYLPQGPAPETCLYPMPTGGILAGPRFDLIRDLLDRAASSDLSVLITGQTGTGKDLAARHLHRAGPRAGRPLVAVNCSAIPEELFESELFGHVKGAFTGAGTDRPGLVREAHGGTLFLDEIGELSVRCQAKLLRVIQDRRVTPVGSARAVEVDVRLVSATNQDLRVLVDQGRFRLDLLARVAELRVELPPLEQRREDIPLLVEWFIRKHGGHQSVKLETLEQLCLRPWPMNIRQLESAVRRAIFLAGERPVLKEKYFRDELMEDPPPAPLPRSEAEPEQLLTRELVEVLRRNRGKVEAASRELGLSPSQVYRRAAKLGVRIKDYR